MIIERDQHLHRDQSILMIPPPEPYPQVPSVRLVGAKRSVCLEDVFQSNINQSIHVHAYIYVHIVYIYKCTYHFLINIYYHVFNLPISKHDTQRCPNISVWSAGGHPGHRCRFRRDPPLAGDARRVAGHLLVRCGRRQVVDIAMGTLWVHTFMDYTWWLTQVTKWAHLSDK